METRLYLETLVGSFVNHDDSDFETYDRLYAEVRTPTKQPAVLLKLILKIQSKLYKRLNNVSMGDIQSSAGNFKKFTNYDKIKALLDHSTTIVKGTNSKSEYLDVANQTLAMLEKNATAFQKAFKKGDNAVTLLYHSSVMYIIDMAVIISEATINMINGAGGVDKHISSNSKYKKIFTNMKELLNDKDFSKLFSVKLDNIIPYAEAEVNEDNVELYGEASIISNLAIIKVGLVGVLYKLCAVARYIIYIYFYTKFSVANRMDTIRQTLDYYGTGDDQSRMNTEHELKKASNDYKVDLVKSDAAATQEEGNDEVTLTSDDAMI